MSTPATAEQPHNLPDVRDDDDELVLPYEQFIAERHKIIDARARAQQRVDQLLTGGAVGALVLSITFLEKIAPSPDTGTRPLLIAAWAGLLVSLGLNLVSHFASCSAFERYLADFDAAYTANTQCNAENPATRLTKWAEIGAAVTFVVGVGLLAWFALVNVDFTTPAPGDAPSVGTTATSHHGDTDATYESAGKESGAAASSTGAAVPSPGPRSSASAEPGAP